jgi:hypothetical protein
MASQLALFLSDLVTGPVAIEVDNASSVTNASQARIAIKSGRRRHSHSEAEKGSLRWGESEQVSRWDAAAPSPPRKTRKTTPHKEIKSNDEPIQLWLNKPKRLPSPNFRRPQLGCNRDFSSYSFPVLPPCYTSRVESRAVNVSAFLDNALLISIQ